MAEYGPYYNTQVRLIVEGRGYDKANYNSETTTSLEMNCTPVSETDNLLHVERVEILNPGLKGTFQRGSFNKRHIIGILEEKVKSD